MSSPVKEKTLSLIADEQMTAVGDRVLTAVSGGADSLTLLHVLLTLRQQLGLGEVAAAHIHHGLRGAEADRDEAAVRAFCEQQGVRLFVCHADVATEARRRGMGVEETGRVVRYEFLQKIAAENGFLRVATAHTLSDAMETVLLHLVRGTGAAGLAGIPPVRGNLIRPLLTCTRAEIETYCAENALPFVVDSTNADLAFARNRVRGCIVPELYSLNPRADEAFARFMRTAREDERYWREQVATARNAARLELGIYRADLLQQLPTALRTRVLRSVVEESGDVLLEERHVRQLERLLTEGGTVTVSGGLLVSVKQNYLTIKSPHWAEPPAERPLCVGESYSFGGSTYRCELWSPEEYQKRKKIHKILLQCTCDYDKIKGAATVRPRRSGDELHPRRRGGSKTLKKWMNECRVPAVRRDLIPLLVDDEGVALVVGLGCDRRVAVDDTTRRVLAFFKSL